MKQLLIATSNKGKFREFAGLLSSQVENVLSLSDFPDLASPDEDAPDFCGNAIIKARHAARATGIPTIADDSGLIVDALGGRPGVLSARYAGEGASDGDNNDRLIKEMAGFPEGQRTARFACCIAFCMPDGTCTTFEGGLTGTILSAPRGNGGFGYDPLFLVAGYEKTLAELDIEVKNRISHRAAAFRKFIRHLSDASENHPDKVETINKMLA